MKISIIIIIFLLTSCANYNSIYRSEDLDATEGKLISVDAKQRFAISKGNKFCAEPSPDAFSVYSAALEASASKPDVFNGALKLATGENGSTIGSRTEVISLMRDAMYRLCEANFSGILSDTQYKEEMAKYQKSMVTLLAINQLTNAVKPPSIILSSTSSLVSGSNLLEVKTKYDEAKKKSDDLSIKTDLKKKEYEAVFQDEEKYKKKCTGNGKPADADQAQCDKYDKLNKEYNSLVLEKNVALQNTAEWKKVQEGEESKISLSTTTSNVITPVSPKQQKMSAAEIKVVSQSVENLVKSVYSEENMMTKCFESAFEINELEKQIKKLNKKSVEVTNINKSLSNLDKDGLKNITELFNADNKKLIGQKILIDFKNNNNKEDLDKLDENIQKIEDEINSEKNSEKFKLCKILLVNYIEKNNK